jgi:hypothetical protein
VSSADPKFRAGSEWLESEPQPQHLNWLLDVGLGAEPGIMFGAAAIPWSIAGPCYKIFRPLFVTPRLTR